MHRIIFLLLAGWITSAPAIVVQNYTASEAPPSSSGYDLDLSYIYNYKGSTAVAVGSHWLLTARHVANDAGSGSLSIDGQLYIQQEIIAASGDLALIRYDRSFAGYYPLYTGALGAKQVLMAGYGTAGTVSSDFWTDSGAGRNVKRWGSQEINYVTEISHKPDDQIGYVLTSGFYMDFDLGKTGYEAGSGAGDSGGGVFYNDGGIWKLAGILALRSPEGSYHTTFAASVPEYADWVTANMSIPEPQTLGLIGLSASGIFFMRCLRNHKRIGRSLLPAHRVYACDLFEA